LPLQRTDSVMRCNQARWRGRFIVSGAGFGIRQGAVQEAERGRGVLLQGWYALRQAELHVPSIFPAGGHL